MNSTKKIIVLGATGGCADIVDVIADINRFASSPVYDCVGFLDDNPDLLGARILGVEVVGKFADAAKFEDDCFFVSGIGSPYNFWKRGEILENLEIPIERFETIIHPLASISSFAEIGRGCVLFQHAVISTKAAIGDHVLVLPNVTISHDCSVGAYSIITAGVCLSGSVAVRESCYLGSNATVRQDIKIGPRSLIGMSGVVVSDVPPDTVVVGNPARRVKVIEDL
jgi:sugar O-acyltransferase (sialic acid O-acetyltransferase NeuD family)